MSKLMNRISPLKNIVQEYSWGSYTAIPELLGDKSPSKKPQAELWMGAHPKASSKIYIDEKWVSLEKAIHAYPADILGKETAEKFSNTLPYLFKVLAAEKPLSIQAHPHRFAAKEGFLREDSLQIPLDADNRNYKDRNHKPECICALTPFWVLCGFRPIQEILSFAEVLYPAELQAVWKQLEHHQNSKGLELFFHSFLTMTPDMKKDCIHNAVRISKEIKNTSPEFEWIKRLYQAYPEDIGILAPTILNLVCLEPGQGMYLGAGELHAYLYGTGIELMANSDNVLRGGLTPKHIDVKELLNVLNFQAHHPEILFPQKLNDTEAIYEVPAEEFRLSRIRVQKGKAHSGEKRRSAEILICIEGAADISNPLNHLEVKKGESVVIPAASPGYKISGTATFYKAAVPYPS